MPLLYYFYRVTLIALPLSHQLYYVSLIASTLSHHLYHIALIITLIAAFIVYTANYIESFVTVTGQITRKGSSSYTSSGQGSY